jgi:predicted Zn-dependent peptidase
LDDVQRHGITLQELERAKVQLNARFVFENDSIANVAHQIGYFEAIGADDVLGSLATRVAAVTLEQVAHAASALLVRSNRTVGWFDPSTGAQP